MLTASQKFRTFSLVHRPFIAFYIIKTKVAFLEGRLLTSQSEQFKKNSKSSDWLEKSQPSKKATFVLIM